MTDNPPPPLGRLPRTVAADGTDSIVAIIETMAPYLDQSGTARCRVKSDSAADSLDFRLRERSVRAVIGYAHSTAYGSPPRKERVTEGLDFVEGKLLSTRAACADLQACPTARCFRRLLEDDEGGQGSAEEVLILLRRVAKKHRVLRGGELLPNNAIAMGKWLARNQLRLRSYGIELSRPARRATKRLWAWEQIVPNDGDDATQQNASLVPGGETSQQITSPDVPDDAMTDDFLLEALGDSCNANDM